MANGEPKFCTCNSAIHGHCRCWVSLEGSYEIFDQHSPRRFTEDEVRAIVRAEIARALDGIVPYNKP